MTDEPDDMRARLRHALRVSKDYEETYENGVIGQILSQNEAGNFLTPAEDVPGLLFNDKPDCASAIMAYLRAQGDPLALEDYGAYLFRQAGGIKEDGSLDVAVQDQWEARYSSALSALPGLQNKLDELRQAHREILEIQSRAQRQREYITQSPAMLFVEHSPMTATEKFFALPDTTEAMHALLERMDGNQAAIDGLKKTVLDYIIERVGVTDTRAANYFAFLAANEAALAVLFDEKAMQTFRNVGADLAQTRLSLPIDVPEPSGREGRLPTSKPKRGWWRFGAR